MPFGLIFRAGVLLLTFASAALGADTLPYSQRTRSYGTNDATSRGDIRTVGMASAVIGLADTAIASLDNPSGQAMTLNMGDLNFASNSIQDRNIQNYDSPVSTNHFGLAVAPYPWAFGLALVSPYREGQDYQLSSAGNPLASLSVSAREVQFTVSRVQLKNRLSAGMTLRFGSAFEELTINGATQSAWAPALGATWGVMGQLNDRVLLGMSLASGMYYNFDSAKQPDALPGFFRNLQSPYRLSFGAGWIPNRYLRLGSSINFIGPTVGAALLKDENVAVGQAITPQPRLGFNYVFADFKNFEGQIFGGTYLEISRVQDAASRLHFTTGVELKPWLLVIGAGVDLSSNYGNFIVGAGINILRTMEALELIPRFYNPIRRGMIRSPFYNSDEGLARPLAAKWDPQGPALDPVKVMLDLPKKIENKIEQIGDTLQLRPPQDEPLPETQVSPPKNAKPKKSKHRTRTSRGSDSASE